MPRKRYYCDFCDKAFADNQTNRRNHLNGVQHKTARQAHYDSFKAFPLLLAEDAGKKECRRFFQEGQCKFGRGCKFSHISKDERELFMEQEHSRKMEESSKQYHLENFNGIDIVKDWLTEDKLEVLQTSSAVISDQSQHRFNLKLPESIASFNNLPPSLLPYTFHNIIHHSDWG